MVAKWSGILSTTEPRNDIGILNVRQGNKNSEIAEFQIIENNKPYDLTGFTVLFCASFGLNQVEKTASVVNAKEGKISYTFDDDAMQQVGRQKGYFSIKKAEAMIDSTQEFEYRIQSSIYSRLIDAKSYIFRLNELMQLLEDFVTNSQSSFSTWFDSVKEILYGVDPGGNILRELIEARNGILGKVFPSLKARLDTFETETTAQFQQIVINIKDFGAVGDGVTDDTVAIQNAINSLKKGDKLLIPVGVFKNSGLSVFARGVEIEFRGELLYTGTGSCLTIGNYFLKIINPNIKRNYTGKGVAKEDLLGIGIDVAHGKNCTIESPVVEGFKYGIALHDDVGTGAAYLVINNPQLINNLVGYKCLIDTEGGWTNESKMFGGRITLDVSQYSDITGSAYFDLLGDVHRFYGVCAEGKPERKVKGNFDESTFDGCRFEQTNGDIDIEINGNGNSFIRNRDWENVYKNNGVSNVILSRWYSYFGNPVIQPIKQFKSTLSDSILRPNADHVHYLIDCSINKTDVSFTMSTLKNGTIFTFKKIDSTSNEVNIGAVNVDNTHVNPRLTRQNETIKLMVLDGKFILLDNENYTFNLGFNHVTYGLGMKRKITPENANYMRFESEICVESGTTGSFSGVIANGISGHDRVTLTGDTSRMTKDSWITLIGANYYVVNWDSTTKIATLKTGLNQTISNVVLARKNPVFVYCDPVVYRQSVVPTSGTWKQGDVVYNSKPAINSEIGWVCITAGTPGTWKQFGMIQA